MWQASPDRQKVEGVMCQFIPFGSEWRVKLLSDRYHHSCKRQIMLWNLPAHRKANLLTYNQPLLSSNGKGEVGLNFGVAMISYIDAKVFLSKCAFIHDPLQQWQNILLRNNKQTNVYICLYFVLGTPLLYLPKSCILKPYISKCGTAPS